MCHFSFNDVVQFFISLSYYFLTFFTFGLWGFITIELSSEFVDVERQSSSDEFFDASSHSETPPHIAQTPPLSPAATAQHHIAQTPPLSPAATAQPLPPAAAQPPPAQETPEIERKHFPWLISSIVTMYAGIYVITMYVNNCRRHTFPSTACFPHFMGRLSFQPTDQNPLYGPSRETLINMGGLYLRKVLDMHQVWRLLTNIWLHEGFTQLLTDIVTICGVGIQLEQKYGFVPVLLLYLISGLGGSLASALFIQSRVTVGASGALAGLAGGSISKTFMEYWTQHLPMGFDFLLAVGMMLANIVVTIVQHGDNFANLGGSVVGVLVGFVIFAPPPVNRLHSSILSIVTFLGLFTGMMMVLKGVNMNDHCSWCHYLDCIPFPGWSCKFRGTECDSNIIGNSLYLKCISNGRTGVFPLVNDNPPETIEELCYRLCR